MPSGEIDIHSILRAEFIVINEKYVEHSVETPTTAAEVFKLVLRGSNKLREQRELLGSVDQWGRALQLFEAHVHLLRRQMISSPVESEAVSSEVSRFETSLQAGSHQLLGF